MVTGKRIEISLLFLLLLFSTAVYSLGSTEAQGGTIEMVNKSNEPISFTVTCKIKGVCFSKIFPPGGIRVYTPLREKEFSPVNVIAQKIKGDIPSGPKTQCDYKPDRKNIIVVTPRHKLGAAKKQLLIQCLWR